MALTPEDVVRSYIKEMNAWELECGQRREVVKDVRKNIDIGLPAYMEIYKRWCSQKKCNPREGEFSMPPDYDLALTKFLGTEIKSAKEVEVKTLEATVLKRERIYKLCLEDGEWRIYKRYFINMDGKRVAESL